MGRSSVWPALVAVVITGYVGLIGQGKTMLAVREAVALARRRGAILASNIRLNVPDVETVQLTVGDEGLDGVPQLLTLARAEGRGVVILVDEIGIILPARFWQTGMSMELMWAVSQSRKLAADLIFTAQDVEQVDAYLRRLTQWVTKVRAVPNPSIERREQGKRPWFFMLARWRPASVDKPDKRLGRGWTLYRRSDEGTYDTDELVRPPSHLARGRRRQAAIAAPEARPTGDPSRAATQEQPRSGRQALDGVVVAGPVPSASQRPS